MPTRFLLPVLSLAAMLPGCTEFPDIHAAESPQVQSAPYPALAPLETVLAQTQGATLTEETAAGISAQGAAAQARGAALLARPLE